MSNRMKFITDFCLYFAVFATIWVVPLSRASIYSWGAAIAFSVACALISNHYNGKHDE